ncbi:MAG TPA: type II secretion system protein GspJ [Myxococcales bacterium]|nr:type II secretion system protein GspJ [Myxococcales bacterium]
MRRGFTLLEALISLAIMAFMGALIWGSFGPSWQLKETVEQQADRDAEIRLAMNRMAREISMAYLSNDYDKTRYRQMLTVFDGRHNAGDHDTLTFTSLSHQRLYENALESDESLIQYKLVENPQISGQVDLVRREKTVMDDEPERGGTEDVLCEDVQGLQLLYWDPVKMEWEEDWNTLDVERANTLPFRVKITLLIGEPGAIPTRYTTQAEIALPQPLDRTQ